MLEICGSDGIGCHVQVLGRQLTHSPQLTVATSHDGAQSITKHGLVGVLKPQLQLIWLINSNHEMCKLHVLVGVGVVSRD